MAKKARRINSISRGLYLRRMRYPEFDQFFWLQIFYFIFSVLPRSQIKEVAYKRMYIFVATSELRSNYGPNLSRTAICCYLLRFEQVWDFSIFYVIYVIAVCDNSSNSGILVRNSTSLEIVRRYEGLFRLFCYPLRCGVPAVPLYTLASDRACCSLDVWEMMVHGIMLDIF